MNTLTFNNADLIIRNILDFSFKFLTLNCSPKIGYVNNMPPNTSDFFIEEKRKAIIFDRILIISFIKANAYSKLFNLICSAARAFWQAYGNEKDFYHEEVENEHFEALYADVVAWALFMHYKKYHNIPDFSIQTLESKSKTIFMEKRIKEILNNHIREEKRENPSFQS